MHRNKIGLEAEFLLRKDGELVYPGDYKFGADDFMILGEVRAKPAATLAETLANFWKVWYQTIEKADKNGLDIDLSGCAEISPAKYAEIMRKMGTKEVARCRNINGIDLLSLSDAVVKQGKILHYNISSGLHIHFSSEVTRTATYKRTQYDYTPANIPLSLNGVPGAMMSFYLRGEKKEIEKEIEATVSRITMPVLKYIVENLDKAVLPNYSLGVPLKYRNPGFYEIKSYGFEYRSLPFSQKVLDDLFAIVKTCFNLLESLDVP